MTEQDFDITNVSPEEFARLVAAAEDDQIASVVKGSGSERVLERIFQGMQERFVAEKAKDVDAQAQFVITDDGTEYPYGLTIKDEQCQIAKGEISDPKVTITTDVVSFIKLVSGKAQGPQLFMTGKLKLKGDIFFSQRIMGFFDRPKA